VTEDQIQEWLSLSPDELEQLTPEQREFAQLLLKTINEPTNQSNPKA